MSLVGIVLVSHSAKLAEGLAELAGQLGSSKAPIVAAGGMDDGGLGTSPDKIERAIHDADDRAGVVVLADIGSAVLAVKLLLEDDLGVRVALADAPLVEGTISAAVAAGAGADIEAVVAAAEEARGFKKLSG